MASNRVSVGIRKEPADTRAFLAALLDAFKRRGVRSESRDSRPFNFAPCPPGTTSQANGSRLHTGRARGTPNAALTKQRANHSLDLPTGGAGLFTTNVTSAATTSNPAEM